jgi:hypothetical protein
MTSFQSPEMLTDLYRDLRDRRLMPLVVVLLVGIAVVPMALSSSGQPAAPSVAPPSPVAQKSKAPAQQVVVSDPGVRDYKRRLRDDSPADPFVQKFVSPPAGTGATQSAAPGSTSSASTSTGAGAAPETGSTAPPPSGGSAPQPQTESRFYQYRIKVRAGKLGEDLKVYDSVGGLKKLPSDNVPALAFLGVTTDSSFQPTRGVFLVSSAVSSLDGEGSCTFAGTYCQLLSLKPGEHEDLVWTDGEVYRVELVKFVTVVRKHPPSVSGEGSSGSGGGGGGSAGRSERNRMTAWHFSF